MWEGIKRKQKNLEAQRRKLVGLILRPQDGFLCWTDAQTCEKTECNPLGTWTAKVEMRRQPWRCSEGPRDTTQTAVFPLIQKPLAAGWCHHMQESNSHLKKTEVIMTFYNGCGTWGETVFSIHFCSRLYLSVLPGWLIAGLTFYFQFWASFDSQILTFFGGDGPEGGKKVDAKIYY